MTLTNLDLQSQTNGLAGDVNLCASEPGGLLFPDLLSLESSSSIYVGLSVFVTHAGIVLPVFCAGFHP